MKSKNSASNISQINRKKKTKTKNVSKVVKNSKVKKKNINIKNKEEFESSDSSTHEYEDDDIDNDMELSNFEDEDDADDIELSQNAIKRWERELSDGRNVQNNFKKVQQALNTLVANIKDEEEGKKSTNKSAKFSSPQVFNAIIRLCLSHIPSALHKMFNMKSLSDRPINKKRWLKLKPSIKVYLKDFISLIKSISEPSNIAVILKKGVLPILPFYVEFPNLSWALTKQLGVLWCTSHEKVRVLSVVALFRIFTSFKENKKDKALKYLYLSYVNNCRFTSPTTWPLIDFMRMSLVELYNTDHAIAYRQAFLYIRQLALHLRNAMLIQKEERLQLVYSWQFVHCLHFWSDLLAKTHPSPTLKPLIYPVIQIAIGVMTLMKSPRYIPTTFHICNILTDLSDSTGNFIPVLPHLLEVLSCPRLFMKPKKSSMKPIEWDCALKVSSAQIEETDFCDGIIERVFDGSLKYLNTNCNLIAFPELIFPLTTQMKAFLKKCRVPNYTRKIKSLLDKVNENADFINQRRKNVPFSLTEEKAIKNWEIETEQSNPPLRALHNHWKQLKAALHKGDKNVDDVDEFSIKSLKKRQKDEEEDEEEEDDIEDEEIIEEIAEPLSNKKNKRKAKEEKTTSKKPKKKIKESELGELLESGDVVREMKLDDFEVDSDVDDTDDEFESDGQEENEGDSNNEHDFEQENEEDSDDEEMESDDEDDI